MPTPRHLRRLTLRAKLLGAMLFLSIAPIITISYFTFQNTASFFRERLLHSLDGIAYLKSEAINTFVEGRVREVTQLTAMPHLSAHIAELMAHVQPQAAPGDEAAQHVGTAASPAAEGTKAPVPAGVQELVKVEPAGASAGSGAAPAEGAAAEAGTGAGGETAEQHPSYEALNVALSVVLADKAKYEELLLLDPSGVVRVSTYYEHEGKSAAHNAYFTEGLKDTSIQTIERSELTGAPSMVIATPVHDAIGKTIAVFAARLNLTTFYGLLKTGKGLGETGETLAGKRIGDEIVFMAPTRYDEHAAFVRKLDIGEALEFPLREAAREREGAGFHQDYRGEEVLAAWRYIPSLAWGLVVKVDAKEALRPILRVRLQVILVSLLLVLMAGFLSTLLARGIVGPLRELTEAADSISRGNLDVKLMIKSNDEVGDLALSFERMVAAIRFLREKQEG